MGAPANAERAYFFELAWTVAARATDGVASFASAVLHAQGSSVPAGAGCHAETVALQVQLIAGSRQKAVVIPGPLLSDIRVDARWIHLRITGSAGQIVDAVFESGRLTYCNSTIPELAGLGGATYDPPSGTIDVTGGLPQ